MAVCREKIPFDTTEAGRRCWEDLAGGFPVNRAELALAGLGVPRTQDLEGRLLGDNSSSYLTPIRLPLYSTGTRLG